MSVRGYGMVIKSGSAEVSTGMDARQQGFVHSALLYRSQQEYVDSVVRFVLDGLGRREPVLVAVPGDKLALLREALRQSHDGGFPDGLRLEDSCDIARNPSRFLAIESAFVAEHPDQRVRIVSQLVWPGRTSAEYLACVEHEALVNGAFDGRDVVGLCLYDAAHLDEAALADARSTHPLVWSAGSAHRSREYDPDEALARSNQPLPANPGAVTYTVNETADLRPARSFAMDYAGWVGLSRDGIEDLQMIASELATNSLMYTDGGCRLAFWRNGKHLVCEARDSGRFDDRLAGRRPPDSSGTASRGLYLVNAMADLVRTHTTTAGTTIQAYLRFEPAAGPTG
jgi:anti-sigma regulatory factor (Ser/Thr protein kinase)